MMNIFWAKRFLTVATGAFAFLTVVYLVKGLSLGQALSEAFVWGIISSAIFTAVGIYRSGQGQHCSYCHDSPDEQGAGECQR